MRGYTLSLVTNSQECCCVVWLWSKCFHWPLISCSIFTSFSLQQLTVDRCQWSVYILSNVHIIRGEQIWRSSIDLCLPLGSVTAAANEQTNVYESLLRYSWGSTLKMPESLVKCFLARYTKNLGLCYLENVLTMFYPKSQKNRRWRLEITDNKKKNVFREILKHSCFENHF